MYTREAEIGCATTDMDINFLIKAEVASLFSPIFIYSVKKPCLMYITLPSTINPCNYRQHNVHTINFMHSCSWLYLVL